MTGVLPGAENVSVTSGVGTANPSGAPEFPPVFSVVQVTRSLVLCVCFADRSLTFCTFFGHCVVCSYSIYDSDYPFGIFEFFLIIYLNVIYWIAN